MNKEKLTQLKKQVTNTFHNCVGKLKKINLGKINFSKFKECACLAKFKECACTLKKYDFQKVMKEKSVLISEYPVPETIWSNPIHFLAFGFGVGASPWAPGTLGTLIAVPFFILLHDWPIWLYATIVIAATVVGVYLCEQASKDVGVEDHPGIVWDEFCGYLIAMFMVPATWFWIIFGFILFRIFDIVKPWPINQLDKTVKGGLGVMLDDVMAAVYTWLILQVLLFIF